MPIQTPTPTIKIVTSGDDTTGSPGTTSLRDAIIYANGTSGEVDILFAPNVHVVTLTKELPIITGENVVIDGTQASGSNVTINASGFRPFIVGDAGTTPYITFPLTLKNITVTGGTAQGGAGTDGGGGGAGLGGAVLVTSNGTLTLNGATLTSNSATGGAGADETYVDFGGGGGLGGTGGPGLPAGGGGLFRADNSDIYGDGGGANGGSSQQASAYGNAGGFGGGGGGTVFNGAVGGMGGFGGGGGGVDGLFSGGGTGGLGGFGGGGGASFTDAGTTTGGNGGFGGGGGGSANSTNSGVGGFAAGSAPGTQGGGGAGLGGAVFVQAGGTVSITGNTTESGSTVTPGNAGQTYGGKAYGSGFFFQGPVGSTQTLTFGDGIQSIADDIADYLGSPGSTANSTNLANQGGSVALDKSGSGTLTLSGANTYSGGTTLSGGEVAVSSDGNLGTSTGGLTFNGGTLQVTGTAYTSTGRTIAFSGGGFNIVNSGNTFTVSQTLGSGALTKSGSGILTLSATNTYSGGTTFSGGEVSVSSDDNLGSSTGSLTFNGGTLKVTGAGYTSTTRTIAFNGGGFDIADPNNIFTVSQALGGTGSLTKSGSGTLTLSASDTYSGATTISTGTLALSGTGSIAGSSGVAVGTGTTFDISGTGSGASIKSLSGSGTAKLGNEALNLTAANGTFSGKLSGSGNLSVTGTETLSGDNSALTGRTSVTTGSTLLLGTSGSLAGSATTVNSSATLGGSGQVGALDVEGGTLSPGNSPGQITVNGNLSLDDTSTYVEQLGGTTAGTGYDQTVVAANADTVNLGGATLSLQLYNGFTPSLGQSYTILDNQGNSAITGTFAGLAQGATVTQSGYSFQISYTGGTGNDVVLTETGVPSSGGNSGGGGTGGGGSTPIPVIAPPVVNPSTNNTPTTLLPGPSVSFDPSVSVSGQTVTMTLITTAQAGIRNLHVFEGTTDLGAATLNDDGTWSFALSNGSGFHTDLTAVVTDNQGLQASAPSYYDLTTGVRGQPYKVEQDSYDPSSYAYEGSTYFKRNGTVYLQSAYTALPEGGATYTYTGGTFFDDKVYTSFADTYDTDGNLTQHVENNADGSHYFEIDGADQTVKALGSDVFSDNAESTRFIFGHQDGHETIYGFQAAAADHDTLSMVHTDAAALANILASGHNDSTGSAVLNFGHGTVVTLAGVDIAEVHLKDFLRHA